MNEIIFTLVWAVEVTTANCWTVVPIKCVTQKHRELQGSSSTVVNYWDNWLDEKDRAEAKITWMGGGGGYLPAVSDFYCDKVMGEHEYELEADISQLFSVINVPVISGGGSRFKMPEQKTYICKNCRQKKIIWYEQVEKERIER